jgi:hypothetical protein
MEGAIMLADDKFTSIGKDSWKLKCDHIIVVRNSLHPHQNSSQWRLGNCACGGVTVLTVIAVRTLVKMGTVELVNVVLNYIQYL